MLSAACLAWSLLGASPPLSASRSPVREPVDPSLLRYVSARSNVRYTENGGQWDQRAKFWAHGGSTDVWLTSTGLVYGFHGPAKTVEDPGAPGGKRQEPCDLSSVIVDFVGASGKGVPVGIKPVPGIERFYLGKEPMHQAHAFGAAEIRDLYPGIDLVSYVDPQANRPRYDLIVHPGADASQIRMRYKGAKNLTVSREGEVRYETAFGPVSEQRQMATQEGPHGAPFTFTPRQVMEKDGTIGFDVEGYRKDRTLVIDPVVWSTYLGDGTATTTNAIKVDPTDGGVIVTGGTTYDFPNTTDLNNNVAPAYVAKMAADGQSLVFASYLNQASTGTALCTDARGNIYICGNSPSQSTVPAGCFSASFTSGGINRWTDLLGSNQGGLANQRAWGVAVTSGGTVIVVGQGDSQIYSGQNLIQSLTAAFVTMSAIDGSNGGVTFVSGAQILGGTSQADAAFSVAVDSSDNVYIAGRTLSADFPATTGQTSLQGNEDAFVTKLDSNLNVLAATLVGGGAGGTSGNCIGVNANGVYIAGTTIGNDRNGFMAVNGWSTLPAQSGLTFGQPDFQTGFVAQLSADLSTVTASTLLGGSYADYVFGLALDGAGNVDLAGMSDSTDFPVTDGSSQGWGFAASMSPNLTQLTYGTYIGSPYLGTEFWYSEFNYDAALGIDVDSAGNLYIAGITDQSGLATSANALQGSFPGGQSGFVSALLPPPQATVTTSRGATPAIAGGVGLSFTATVTLPPTFAGGTVTLASADGGANVQVDGMPSDSFTLAAGAGSQPFTVTAANDVASDTPVVLTATTSDAGTGSSTVTVTVKPFINPTNPPLGEYAGLVYHSASVAAGNHIAGTVHVFEAPATNQTINILATVGGSSSSDLTLTSAPVVVPAGQAYSNPVNFSIAGVNANEVATVTATAPSGISSASASFTILGVQVKSATFTPPTVVAGANPVDGFGNPIDTVSVQLTSTVSVQTQFVLYSQNHLLASDIPVTVLAGSSVGTGVVTTLRYGGTVNQSVAFDSALNVGTPAFAGRLYLTADQITSIVFAASPVNSGYAATATVNIASSSPNDQTIPMTLTPAVTGAPTCVTIPANTTSGTYTFTPPYAVGGSAAKYTLSGTYPHSVQAIVSATPNSIQVIDLSAEGDQSQTSFSELDTIQVGVGLAFRNPTDGTVNVTSSVTSVIANFTVDLEATDGGGSTQVTPSFGPLSAAKVITLTATCGKSTFVKKVTIYPDFLSVTLDSGTTKATAVSGGATVNGTINLFDPPYGTGGYFSVTIMSKGTATLPNGTTTQTFGTNETHFTFAITTKPRPAGSAPIEIIIQVVGPLNDPINNTNTRIYTKSVGLWIKP